MAKDIRHFVPAIKEIYVLVHLMSFCQNAKFPEMGA
jgi:hypothetical protein